MTAIKQSHIQIFKLDSHFICITLKSESYESYELFDIYVDEFTSLTKKEGLQKCRLKIGEVACNPK